jgi:DNA-binding protein H-NS
MGAEKASQLSTEEQKIVTELCIKYRPLIMEQKNQLAVKQAELQAVMAQEKFEADKAKSLSKEISALHSELMELHIAKKIEMREKGITSAAVCGDKGRRSRPCAVGTETKAPGCKARNTKQCAKNKPCKL